MSLRYAARRVALPGQGASSCPGCSSPVSSVLSASSGIVVQRRGKWTDTILNGWRSKNTPAKEADATKDLNDPRKRNEFMSKWFEKKADNNIFQDELETPQDKQAVAGEEDDGGANIGVDSTPTQEALAIVEDPDPRGRVRWQRKKIIQMVRRNGEVSREDRIKMTEREIVHQSTFLPTSVKKLVMLSRQIAGKPVDEAITQMTWSKKKMAAEVKYFLELARDRAITERGMGLGRANNELLATPRKIQDKDGKWLEIADPTRMYVAQTWVGRGPWRGKRIDYKGRGRMGIIKHPQTSITLLLKEEKTRIREHDEREAKKAAKKPWVHLPDRPVYGQRPYYSW